MSTVGNSPKKVTKEVDRTSTENPKDSDPDGVQTLFKDLYIVRDGFIQMKNKAVMAMLSLLLAVSIVSFFVHYCLTDDRCVVMKPPVISRLLYIKQINVRFYILFSAWQGAYCTFFNIRVNYKQFAQFLSPMANKLLFCLGLVQIASQPLLGVFDQHEYFSIHVFFASCFFMSTSFYLIISATIYDRNRQHFSKKD